MGNAEKFLRALGKREEIRRYMLKCPLENGMDETDRLVVVARHFGYDVAKSELDVALKAMGEEVRASMEAAEDAVYELTDEELDMLSGGLSRDVCEDSYSASDIFTCWTLDGCMSTVVTYWQFDRCTNSINPSCVYKVTA